MVSISGLYRLSNNKNITFFLIGIVGGGVQVRPLGTAATNRPIETASADYDDGKIGGMMIVRGNRSTRRKPAPVPLCPPQTPHACPDANPGRCGGKPATNRLSYGMAKHYLTHNMALQYVSHQLSFTLIRYKARVSHRSNNNFGL
jgi:hypothetical protein